MNWKLRKWRKRLGLSEEKTEEELELDRRLREGMTLGELNEYLRKNSKKRRHR